MAKISIFHLGKANEQIDALTAEASTSREQLKNANENISLLEQSAASANAQVTASAATISALQAELATANTTISANASAFVTIKAELATAQAAIADPAGVIEKRASARAVEIAAAQGVPAIVTKPGENPAAPAKEKLKGMDAVRAAIRAEIGLTS